MDNKISGQDYRLEPEGIIVRLRPSTEMVNRKNIIKVVKKN